MLTPRRAFHAVTFYEKPLFRCSTSLIWTQTTETTKQLKFTISLSWSQQQNTRFTFPGYIIKRKCLRFAKGAAPALVLHYCFGCWRSLGSQTHRLPVRVKFPIGAKPQFFIIPIIIALNLLGMMMFLILND